MRDWFIRRVPLQMRTASGMWVELRNRSELDLYRSIFVADLYPLAEVAHYLEGVEAPVVLDVGANCGFFTALVLDRWPDASVHAFEPQKQLVASLQRFVDGNALSDRVSLNWTAVSNTEGEARFFAGRNPISASLLEGKMARRVKRVTRVPVTTLDRYCADPCVSRVDILKIDVEGSELDVLEAASSILPSVRVVFIEIHPPHSSCAGVCDRLNGFGLVCLNPPESECRTDCIFVRRPEGGTSVTNAKPTDGKP